MNLCRRSLKVIYKVILIAILLVINNFGISQTTSAEEPEKTPIPYQTSSFYGSNLIRYHMLNLIINEFTISYERILNNGKSGIQIPVSFGYDKEPVEVPWPPPFEDASDPNQLVTKFETGVNFNLYPGKQGIFKYYLGPGLRFGTGFWYQDVYGYNSPSLTDPIDTDYLKFFVNNGFLWSPAQYFAISLNGFIGIQHSFEATEKETQTIGGLSFELIARF